MTTAVAAPVGRGLRGALRDAAPLLVGVGLLMAGNGLTGTLLGVRAGLEGFGPAMTGVVLAGYYAGFLAGSLVAPSTIARVGHVRVFAGLASLASAAVLVHVVQPEPVTWFVLRALSGTCISALYVVTETWLNGAATNSTRGGLLAGYMVVVSAGLLGGQLLFSLADPGGFAAFVLASVLVSMAVVPVSLARVDPPPVPDPTPMSLRELVRVAPLAPVAAALAGFTAAAMVGAGAIYAVQAGLGRGATAALIGASLAGGLALQVPVGRWSDRTDRRLVIIATGTVGAALAVAAALAGPGKLALVVALATVAGGVSYPLYSLSSAHLNDYLEEGHVVSAGARMVLVNGLGAVGGPIVGAAAIEIGGPGSLFVVVGAGHAMVALYAAWRLTRRAAVPEAERASYSAVPLTGTTVGMLAEGTADEIYPTTEGEIDLAGRTLPYRERGAGTPLLVLGDAPDGWDALLAALATDGLRAITPTLGERHRDEDLLAVLRELDLPCVALLGREVGIDDIVRLAEQQPERVLAAVLVGDAHPELPVATLALEDDLLQRDPEGFADAVAEFVRHR